MYFYLFSGASSRKVSNQVIRASTNETETEQNYTLHSTLLYFLLYATLLSTLLSTRPHSTPLYSTPLHLCTYWSTIWLLPVILVQLLLLCCIVERSYLGQQGSSIVVRYNYLNTGWHMISLNCIIITFCLLKDEEFL